MACAGAAEGHVCVFQVVLKCVNRLGFAAIGGRNLHCRVCRRREESPPGMQGGMGCDGGNSGEKGVCSGPDKVEHQQTHPECASCRSDMQSKSGVFFSPRNRNAVSL